MRTDTWNDTWNTWKVRTDTWNTWNGEYSAKVCFEYGC